MWILNKTLKKLHVLLNYVMENGYLRIVKHACRTTLERILLRKRKFSEGFVDKIKKIIVYYIFIYWKLWRLWDNVKKYGRSRHWPWLYNTAHAFCMLLHNAMYTQRKYNLLLFHFNNIYTTVPQYRGCDDNACFICCSLCTLSCWSVLNVKFPHAMFKLTFFLTKYVSIKPIQHQQQRSAQ